MEGEEILITILILTKRLRRGGAVTRPTALAGSGGGASTSCCPGLGEGLRGGARGEPLIDSSCAFGTKGMQVFGLI